MAQSFWDASSNLISVTEKHPFLISMVNGTLDVDKFRYYAIQDAFYLTDFSDCLTQLGDKILAEKYGGDNHEQLSKRLHLFGKTAEEDEKELHRSFFKQWNIDDNNAKVMPNTLLYTSYMIRIVATRPIEEGLAVLLPCFWIYHHVGKCMLELRDKLRIDDTVKRPPQFDAWIDMYAGDDFEREVKEYITIVDDAAKFADSATLKKMEEHFIMSCKLEHMFWDQAHELMQWPDFSG